MSDPLTDLAAYLKTQAVARFDEHGPTDARGAAFWDVAQHITEDRRAHG